MKPANRHRRIRLDSDVYSDPSNIAAITIGTRMRRPVFTDPGSASAAVDVLRGLAPQREVAVYAYCIMPDHVHLVLAPSNSCDIPTFVGRFKNLTQRALWTKGIEGLIWQRSFWDHFLRADEGLRAVIEYVLANPVRAGLVEAWHEYPWTGSFVFEL